MAVNGFTVNKDIRLDLVTAARGPINLGFGTGFSAKQDTVETKVKGLDGSTHPVVIPDAWSGAFDYERTGPTLDRYFADQEEDYFNGHTDETLYITQTIAEPNGAISQFRFERAVLKYDDAGSFSGEATVKQKVSWIAARRRRVL